MVKNTFKGLSVIFGVIFLIGCASKGVETRRYVEVRDRVDQQMDHGNAGYLSGEPQPEDRSTFRKTRKIYVLEVSQGEVEEGQGNDVVEIEDNLDESNAIYEESTFEAENLIEVSRDSVQYPDLDAAVQDDGAESNNFASTASSTVEYTVKKDDTLQKISKQFYDSYSKWPKIYELNKDVIENPDRIKPGIVIQIPME